MNECGRCDRRERCHDDRGKERGWCPRYAYRNAAVRPAAWRRAGRATMPGLHGPVELAWAGDGREELCRRGNARELALVSSEFRLQERDGMGTRRAYGAPVGYPVVAVRAAGRDRWKVVKRSGCPLADVALMLDPEGLLAYGLRVEGSGLSEVLHVVRGGADGRGHA